MIVVSSMIASFIGEYYREIRHILHLRGWAVSNRHWRMSVWIAARPYSSANGFFVPLNCKRIGVPGNAKLSRRLFTR